MVHIGSASSQSQLDRPTDVAESAVLGSSRPLDDEGEATAGLYSGPVQQYYGARGYANFDVLRLLTSDAGGDPMSVCERWELEESSSRPRG